MHENYREYVDRIVDSFPPLTDEQRSKLRMLLAHPPCSECEARHRVEHATATRHCCAAGTRPSGT